jgi:hypothetical protein
MTNWFRAILFGGFLCALLDGVCVNVLYASRGISPLQVWQTVASSVLGKTAFQRGWVSGSLGVALHCLVALSAATLFVLVIRFAPSVMDYYLAAGAAFGVLFFFAMNLIVIPLSAMPKRPFSVQIFLIQLVIHVVFVGLPIAKSARWILE